MPEEKRVKAIVTRAIPYKESDMIVTLVSLEEGRLTASARGCLKPKAKLRYAAEPMSFGDYILNGSGDRYIITDCSQIEAFTPVTADIDKYYAAILILDVLQKLSVGAQPQLMLHALNALNTLAYSPSDSDETVTDFLLNALADNGSALDFSHCAVCKCDLEAEAGFSVADGIVCVHCRNLGTVPIDAVTRAYIGGENRLLPKRLKIKANMLLAELVYTMLGVRIGNHYFTEQI